MILVAARALGLQVSRFATVVESFSFVLFYSYLLQSTRTRPNGRKSAMSLVTEGMFTRTVEREQI